MLAWQWWWAPAISAPLSLGRLLLLWVPIAGPWFAIRTLLRGEEAARRRGRGGFRLLRLIRLVPGEAKHCKAKQTPVAPSAANKPLTRHVPAGPGPSAPPVPPPKAGYEG